MPTRRRTSPDLASQAFELAFAAPQVVATRMARIAAAGGTPNKRDRVEFMRMGTEKVFAFYESWMSMWASACTSQMQLAQTMSSTALAAMQGKSSTLLDPAWAVNAATQMATASLTPVHRKARANAKRLSRRR